MEEKEQWEQKQKEERAEFAREIEKHKMRSDAPRRMSSSGSRLSFSSSPNFGATSATLASPVSLEVKLKSSQSSN
jgi:hypothetical protein